MKIASLWPRRLSAKKLAPARCEGVVHPMKTKTAFSLIAAASFIFCSAAFATGAKTHEVTGTVLETTPTKIVLQKGAERWEIDLDPQTKVVEK